MSADYSRWPVRGRDFSQVRLEQGRVLTDADWNEQILVTERRERLETIDALGRAVVPTSTADAFRISETAGPDLSIGVGRAYLDGLLVENHGQPGGFDPVLMERAPTGPVAYSAQPWLRNPAPLPPKPYLAYLKAWQRERSAVEEPDLIEPALGVDTSARLQTVWQVKALGVPAGTSCKDADALIAAAESAAGGRLTTDTAVVPGQPDPCRVVPGGGYTGLENQLYRVEVHRGGLVGGAAGATFKWSRDNATVTARVLSINQARDRIVVDSLGRDDVLSIHDGDWVEITDDDHDLAGIPGELRHVAVGGGVDQASRTILLTDPLPAAGTAFPVDPQFRTLKGLNTRVRRWDQAGKVLSSAGAVLTNLDAAAATGAIAVPGATVGVLLEHGIVVRFALEAGGRFRTGDFWMFAARTADASVEHLEAAPPVGIHAHYAPLAVVDAVTTDCRTVVPPLADVEVLRYIGGDGQEATPSYLNKGPIALPYPARVGLERGTVPVAGRTVRFTLIDWPNAGSLPGTAAASLDVPTDANGEASVTWTLGWDGRASQKRQELTAQLLDAAGALVGLPIHFSARLRTADEVAYDPTDCPDLPNAATVQEAIDALCGRTAGDGCCATVRPEQRLAGAIKDAAERHGGYACLCLEPGTYELDKQAIGEIVEVIRELPVLGLSMGGAGARVLLGSPLALAGLTALSISDIGFVNATDGMDALLDVSGCARVALSGISAQLTSGGPTSAVLRVTSPENASLAPTVRVRDCRIVNGKLDVEPPRMFAMEELPDTVRAMILLARSDAPAADTVNDFKTLMDKPEDVRLVDAKAIETIAADNRDVLGAQTFASMGRLGAVIREGKSVPLSRLKTILDRARTVGDHFVAASDAPTAVELVDGLSDVRLEDNVLVGKLVLYGSASRPDSDARLQAQLEKVDWTGIEPGPKPKDLPQGVGQLRVTDNILSRIALGALGSDQILRFLESGELREVSLFDTIVIEGNAFRAPLQAIVGPLVSLASNVIAGEKGASMGFVYANAATVIGNIGSSRGRLLLAAWDSAEIGNRRMAVQPGTHP